MADVLQGKTASLPYDLQTQQVQLARRRKLIEALLAQGRAPSSPVIQAGNVSVANWGDAVGRLAEAFAARQQGRGLAEEESKIASELDTRKRAGVEALAQALGGGGGNVERALLEASTSGIPELAGAAEIYQKEYAKGKPTWQGVMTSTKDLDPAARARIAQETGAWPTATPEHFLPEPKFSTADGLGVTSQGGEFKKAVPLQEYEATTANVAGQQVPVQRASVTREMKPFTGLTQLPASKTEAATTEVLLKQLDKGREDAIAAAQGMRSVIKGQQLLKNIPDSSLGSLANLRLEVNKFIELMGGKALPETANVQELNSALGLQLLEQLRKFAPVSDTDAKNMMQIVGSTTNTKQALQGMLDYALGTYNRRLVSHNDMVNTFSQIPGGEAARAMQVDFRVDTDEPGMSGTPLQSPTSKGLPKGVTVRRIQ